jgi:hypothetical protein
LLGDPIPGSCESRFPLLRNARVAGVQFLISVMVRGAGGYGVKRPSRTTALLPVPRRCPGSMGWGQIQELKDPALFNWLSPQMPEPLRVR